MPTEASQKNGYAYIAARVRVESHIAQLAQARGIELIVNTDPGGVSTELVAHQIRLTYGRSTRIMAVDHDTFMDEEFFRTLVLYQLEAVVNELASAA